MAALKRIKKEFKDMESMPPYNCSIQIPTVIQWDEDDKLNNNEYHVKSLTFNGFIIGPSNTPYHNGQFYFKIQVPQDYPFKPPRVKFISKILHCQINENGSFYFPLRDNWSPRLTIANSMESIVDMLKDPDADNPLLPNIAQLYKTNRRKHDKLVRECTIKHASNHIYIPCINITRRNFEYNAKTEQIECNFTIEYKTQQVSESDAPNIKIIACSKKHNMNIDRKIYATVTPNIRQYSFNIDKHIEYGSILNISSYVELRYNASTTEHNTHLIMNVTNPNSFIFDKESTDIFVDILPQIQYFILIHGFLNHDIIPMDIIKLCFKYYYKYVITFVFKSFNVSEMKNALLVKDIQKEYKSTDLMLENIHDILRYEMGSKTLCTEYIWNVFNLGNKYRDSLKYMMRLRHQITPNQEEKYPMLIEAQIELTKPAVFDANYNDKSAKITIDGVQNYNMKFAKRAIKNAFNIALEEDINIEIRNSRKVTTDLEFLQHLVGDNWSHDPVCNITDN